MRYVSLPWLCSRAGQLMATNFLTAWLWKRHLLHMAYFTEFELFLQEAHFETTASNIGAFSPICPPYSERIDLWPFLSITTKRYTVDRANYTFFWIIITREIWEYMVFDNIEATLHLTSCDPQVCCTGCDLAAVWNILALGFILHNKIIKTPLYVFGWVKLAITRPIYS